MLVKDDVLSILKKYGYNSLNRAPFLYQEKKKIGIYFVWPHKHYGNLERVLFFDTLEEVEEEVYKYWWFMNNKKKFPILVEFDDYETKSPNVIYTYKGSPLSLDKIKNLQENISYFDGFSKEDDCGENKWERNSSPSDINIFKLHDSINEFQGAGYRFILREEDVFKNHLKEKIPTSIIGTGMKKGYYERKNKELMELFKKDLNDCDILFISGFSFIRFFALLGFGFIRF